MPRVLLVDDTPEIAELLTYALRDRGHHVIVAGCADAVETLAVEHQADALVIDCTVFDMSETVFINVRGRPELAELPVVIISDTPEIADARLTARQARRVFLIPKPFTGAQVARALDELLA